MARKSSRKVKEEEAVIDSKLEREKQIEIEKKRDISEFLTSIKINEEMSPADIAEKILLKVNKPLYWKVLVMGIIALKHPNNIQNVAKPGYLSEIYSNFSLDGRFQYQPHNCTWTLTAFLPQETKRKKRSKEELE